MRRNLGIFAAAIVGLALGASAQAALQAFAVEDFGLAGLGPLVAPAQHFLHDFK